MSIAAASTSCRCWSAVRGSPVSARLARSSSVMKPVPDRGDRWASKSRVSFAATSGMRSPETGMSPARARPSRNPRCRIARSSSGSRPSWSRNVDHACACTRSSSAVARTGAPSPSPVASATSACSAVASATGSATGRVRSSSRMIVDAASAPRSPAASADATSGNCGVDRLAGEAGTRSSGRAERDAPPRLERRRLGHPLDEFCRRAAALAR